MNGCRSLLVQVGILVVLLGVFLGIWWICDSVLGLNPPIPLVVTVVTLILFFVVFFWWMIALQKQDDEVLSTVEHPFFGTVRRKRKSWDTSMTVPNLGSDITVSSYEGDLPTQIQEETLQWLCGSMDMIREELEGCLDEFGYDPDTVPPRPRNLICDSILLDPITPNTFCLMFDIEDADLPWGFSASYANGVLDEFTDDH
jgi:hypothetical protein